MLGWYNKRSRVVSTRAVYVPLTTRRERGLVSRFLFTFWPGGFGGSYFYHSYYLIPVKHHKVNNSKDTDYATLTVFLIFFSLHFQLFGLSATGETWLVEMRIWCIKIGIILVLHFNPWIKASAGGLLVPENFYSPVSWYFGTSIKIRIRIQTVQNKKKIL